MPMDISSSRPAALMRGPTGESQVGRDDGARALPHPTGQPMPGRPGRPDALQPGGDQNPVVVIQRHHVGNSAQGDQVSVMGEVRLCPLREPARSRS